MKTPYNLDAFCVAFMQRSTGIIHTDPSAPQTPQLTSVSADNVTSPVTEVRGEDPLNVPAAHYVVATMATLLPLPRASTQRTTHPV